MELLENPETREVIGWTIVLIAFLLWRFAAYVEGERIRDRRKLDVSEALGEKERGQ